MFERFGLLLLLLLLHRGRRTFSRISFAEKRWKYRKGVWECNPKTKHTQLLQNSIKAGLDFCNNASVRKDRKIGAELSKLNWPQVKSNTMCSSKFKSRRTFNFDEKYTVEHNPNLYLGKLRIWSKNKVPNFWRIIEYVKATDLKPFIYFRMVWKQRKKFWWRQKQVEW